MSVKLGTNLLSKNVQRGLSVATNSVASISERLSSGQRISKAADDAAGLAISSSLKVDTRIFGQAIRNINDGISAISIAGGAISELKGVLIRIKELSTQSMNGTFSDTQRSSMQKEVTALQSEWNRIVNSTSFNDVNLLTGAGTKTVLQGGFGLDATLEVQIGEKQLVGGVIGAAGGTTRVSTSSSGAEAAVGSSIVAAISADGRYVAFYSSATNLVVGDTNGFRDAFIKDTVTGVTTRVSTDSNGNQAMGGSSYATAISADGRYVAFDSVASNLVVGDTNGFRDAFIKDTLTGVTTRISTDSAGNQATGGNSYATAISADGRYVAFKSVADNLVDGDTNGWTDSFIKDTVTGITTRVSTDSNGNQATGGGFQGSQVTAISADGRYVAFWSAATNLVAGDTNGAVDSFIKDTVTGVTTRISTDSNGNQADYSSYISAISADGRYVAFYSSATNLVAGDTNGQVDAFIKDTLTGVTTRVSTDSNGNETGGRSYVTAISADGRYVAFHSNATNLVADDTNGQRDSFIKDTVTGITTRISIASDGTQGNGSSNEIFLSADGRTAVFGSLASNLVSGDTNGTGDIFLRDLTRIGINEMSGMLVSNRASASVTFNLVNNLQEKLSSYEGKLGATQSRAQTFVSQLYSQKNETATAETRISSADIAAESSELIRKQILQRTSAALLAQANQQPSLALDLLRNI